MTRYELHIETENPDVVERVKEAFEQTGLDVDNEGALHSLGASLFEVNEVGHSGDMLWGTMFEPDKENDG